MTSNGAPPPQFGKHCCIVLTAAILWCSAMIVLALIVDLFRAPCFKFKNLVEFPLSNKTSFKKQIADPMVRQLSLDPHLRIRVVLLHHCDAQVETPQTGSNNAVVQSHRSKHTFRKLVCVCVCVWLNSLLVWLSGRFVNLTQFYP